MRALKDRKFGLFICSCNESYDGVKEILKDKILPLRSSGNCQVYSEHTEEKS
jgi:hypothetical protein